MDRARDLATGQVIDHALDLAPVTKAHDIAQGTAALGQGRGLEPRCVTVPFDKVGRIVKGAASGDVGEVHCAALSERRLRACRQIGSMVR